MPVELPHHCPGCVRDLPLRSRLPEPADCRTSRRLQGFSREALYKALRPGTAPRFDTVSLVCEMLGVKLAAQPLHSA